MDKFAKLTGPDMNGICTVSPEVIESETDPDGVGTVWVACPAHVGPGFTVNAGRTVWAAPAVNTPRYITQLAFLTRFTDAEAIGIDLASLGATVQAAGMRRYLNKVNAAEFIDLDRADTRAGVQALEAAGALAVGRATTILDAPVQPSERFRGR